MASFCAADLASFGAGGLASFCADACAGGVRFVRGSDRCGGEEDGLPRSGGSAGARQTIREIIERAGAGVHGFSTGVIPGSGFRGVARPPHTTLE